MKGQHVIFPLAAAVVLLSAPAGANPLWSTANCEINSGAYNGMSSTSDTLIHYYVQEDFADNLATCVEELNFIDYTELTEFHIRQHVKDSAELWNAESRGPYLRYAGSYSGDFEQACESGEEPAVYVTFVNGCQVGGGTCNTSTLGTAQAVSNSNCPNSAFIEIYGDYNTQGSCDDSNDGVIAWELQELGHNRWAMRDFLVHEFGHVLGLSHPDTSGVPDVDCSGGVKNAFMCSGNDRTDLFHLFPWEMDCVDQFWDGREGTARSRSYSSSETLKEDETITTTPTEKGSLSGYAWRDSWSYYAYSIHDPSADYRRASVGSDGYLSWADQGSDWGPNPHDQSVLFTNLNPTASNSAHVYYNWTPSKTQSPPLVKAAYSTNNFSSKTFGKVYAWTGWYYAEVWSHIPATSAYNPITDETVFVTVDTSRSSDNGRIRVHPEVRSGFKYLEDWEYVDSNVSTPGDSYSNWDYTLTTYFGVGVACADFYVSGYNCVLAWIDKGTPDNAVLYTWFRTSGTNVIWHGTTYELDWGYGHNHVSVGFFDDQFWLSYKESSSSVGIRTSTNSLSSLTGWSYPSRYVSSGYTVDPPTWAAIGTGNEAAMLWTEDY